MDSKHHETHTNWPLLHATEKIAAVFYKPFKMNSGSFIILNNQIYHPDTVSNRS